MVSSGEAATDPRLQSSTVCFNGAVVTFYETLVQYVGRRDESDGVKMPFKALCEKNQ